MKGPVIALSPPLTPPESEVTFTRNLGLFDATMIVIGAMIGAVADYDLVALGASKERVFSNVLFGEIPEKVARYAQTPVMIVQRCEGSVKSLVKRIKG